MYEPLDVFGLQPIRTTSGYNFHDKNDWFVILGLSCGGYFFRIYLVFRHSSKSAGLYLR